jgi:hypothetical protein
MGPSIVRHLLAVHTLHDDNDFLHNLLDDYANDRARWFTAREVWNIS